MLGFQKPPIQNETKFWQELMSNKTMLVEENKNMHKDKSNAELMNKLFY